VYNNINHTIEKYLAGESSLEEEQLIREYVASAEIAEEHKDLVPMFDYFNTAQQTVMTKQLDISYLGDNSAESMHALVEKYWNGETSLEEEKILTGYLTSDNVHEDHLDMVPMFSFFENQNAVRMEKALDLSFVNDKSTEEAKQTQKTTKTRWLFPKVAAVAASMALLLMFTFNMMNSDSGNASYVEVQDPEEALELRMEALAFLGHNYDKGAMPMKHIKQLEKTNVFNFN